MSPTVESDGLPWEATFVENATRARKALGMSQTALAKKVAAKGLPFHQPTIQRIEAGERPVRLNEAVAIAQVLMMEDLHEAITPNTVERATQILRLAIEQSREELNETFAHLQTFAQRADDAKEEISGELSFYVRTVQGLGHKSDKQISREAEDLASAWWSLHRVLQADQENVRRYAGMMAGFEDRGMELTELHIRQKNMTEEQRRQAVVDDLVRAEERVKKLRAEFEEEFPTPEEQIEGLKAMASGYEGEAYRLQSMEDDRLQSMEDED